MRQHTKLAIGLPLGAAGFVVAACIAIAAISGWHELQTRNSDIRNAEVELTNLGRSLVNHADDTFDLAETLLKNVVERMEVDGAEPAPIARLQAFLFDRPFDTERIRGLFVYDATGGWLATTELGEFKSFNNSDRDYFRYHSHSEDRGRFIGRPVKSKSGGQWIITVSRRFNKQDGTFGGVVLATIDVAYFVKFYRQFDVGQRGAISMLTRDGLMIARSTNCRLLVARNARVLLRVVGVER